jgi:hypothetical protein
MLPFLYLRQMVDTSVDRGCVDEPGQRGARSGSRDARLATAVSGAGASSANLVPDELLPRADPPGATQLVLYDVRRHGDASHDELQNFVDSVAAPEHEQPDWHLHAVSLGRHLDAALLRLKDTERLVLQSRFGFTDEIDHTLQDIAQQLKVSPERGRQIQSEALGKMRRILQCNPGSGARVCSDVRARFGLGLARPATAGRSCQLHPTLPRSGFGSRCRYARAR